MTKDKGALPRQSLLTKLTRLIFMIGVASVLVFAAITLMLSITAVSANAVNDTRQAYDILMKLFMSDRNYIADDDFRIEKLMEYADPDDSELQKILKVSKQKMDIVCDAFDMDYFYLFDINEKDNAIIYYLMSVGSDDSKIKQKAIEYYTYGKTVKMDSLPDSMIRAKEGDENTDVDFTSNEWGTVITRYYPVRNLEGKVVMLLGAEYKAADLVIKIIFRLITVVLFVALLTAILLFITLVSTERRILVPIRGLSDAMDRFVRDYKNNDNVDGKKYLPEGIKYRDGSQDEIDDIADSFQRMSEDIDTYIKDINVLTEERINVSFQMELMKNVQDGIVPEFMRHETADYAVYAAAEPAKMFGGDFYDFFTLDNGKLVFFIGDVSGKGTNAAMFMIMVKTALKEKLKSGMAPNEALNTLNDDICEINPEGMFATIFAGVMDMNTGEIDFANAGHERPLVFCDKPYYQEMDTGIAIGLFEDAGIIPEKMSLAHNSGLLIYTDGVTEAVNPDDELFGSDRLLNYANGVSDIDTAQSKLKSTINDFYGTRERFDDLTFLTLFYK